MIPVALQAEPDNFNASVRVPGAKFLAKTQHPTHRDFKGNNFWKNAAEDVYEAYSRVCAYTCRYIDTPYGSIDHFRSKSAHPHLSFEWSNFRLSLPRVNHHKAANASILDPFDVQPGWFVLDFPSCLVKPGDCLDHDVVDQINASIAGLKLNDDDSFVQDRSDIMMMYAEQVVTLTYLQRRRPFLAAEVERQGIDHVRAAALFKRLS